MTEELESDQGIEYITKYPAPSTVEINHHSGQRNQESQINNMQDPTGVNQYTVTLYSKS